MRINFLHTVNAGKLTAMPFDEQIRISLDYNEANGKKERYSAAILDMPYIEAEYCKGIGNTPYWALQQAINQANQYIKRLEGYLAVAKGNVLLAESILEAEFVLPKEGGKE